MHLVFVTASLDFGGAERVLSELANHCVQKGYCVSVVTLAAPTQKPSYPLDAQINLIQLNQSTQERLSNFKRLKAILKRIFCLRCAIKQLDPTVIISFVDTTNLITLLATWKLRTPVIVSERTHPAYRKKPFSYRTLRLLLYPKASHTVVQTQSAADYFNTLKHISVIPNWVQRVTVTKKQDDFKKVTSIVSVGRLIASKSFDTLIHAFSNIIKQHSNLQLTIYGEGDERANLEALIDSLHLTHKIKLPGTRKDIQTALLEADLFIFPSRYEGFPNALCEAMAVGLPIIASNCSGNRDILRDGIDGRLFPIGDVEALTNVALELINDTPQRQKLAHQALEVTERFSVECVFELWEELINKVIVN